MNEEIIKEQQTSEYWAKKIESEGIDAIEGIFSHDRSPPGNDINRAREKAIEKYYNPSFINKIKGMITNSK